MISLLMFFSLQAFAIENLPCQRLLEPSLEPAGTIVLKGKLEAYWEQGMEDQTGWSIVDEQTRRWLSRNPYDSLFWMKPGDWVDLLWANGEMARGYYHEEGVPRRPYLRDKDGNDVLDSKAFARAFWERADAHVTRKVESKELAEMNHRYALWFKAHEMLKHKRFINIGYGQTFEAAYFQSIGRGKLNIGANGSISISTPKGEAALHYRDTLFVDDGERLHKFEIQNFPYVGTEELLRLIAKPHKALIIR